MSGTKKMTDARVTDAVQLLSPPLLPHEKHGIGKEHFAAFPKLTE